MASFTAAPDILSDLQGNSIRRGLRGSYKWLIGLGSLAFVALTSYSIGLVWLVIRQEPAELRWANDNVVAIDGQHFKDLLACGSHLEHSELSDKCRSADKYNYSWKEPTVAVYSVPNSKPPPAPVTLKDLSDNGQARAIELVAKGSGAADTAWTQLTKTLSSSDSDRGKDPYRVDRVLVATVVKGMDANPGDRFLWTRIFIQPINFWFVGYTLAATDNQTTRVANVESTKSHKLAFDVGLEQGVAGLSKPDPSQSIEQVHKVTAEVNSQYERLGVDIKPDFLRIIRESAAGGDVAGNTAIELSIITDPTTIQRAAPEEKVEKVPGENLVLRVTDAHLTDGVNYLGPQDARITILPQDALPHCPLKANVWMLYERRQIKHGGAHYIEGLQQVDLIRDGEPIHEVEIVPADDIAPAVWSIRMLGKGSFEPSGALQAKTGDGTKHDLVFTDYVMASQLIHWLKAHPSASVSKLQEMEFPDYKGQTLVPFKNTENDCAEHKGRMHMAR